MPLVVRACGRTLILAFLVLVIVAVLPFQPRSLPWDPLTDRRDALALARQRDGALRLYRLGLISLALQAAWQIPLLLGSITSLEQQKLARSNQLKQQLIQGEQTIREAPPRVIQWEWQRLSATGTPGLSQDIRDPEQQRQPLLEQLEQQQQQLGRTISNQDGQGRFALVHNILRNLALSAVYIAGFQTMGRRRPHRASLAPAIT